MLCFRSFSSYTVPISYRWIMLLRIACRAQEGIHELQKSLCSWLFWSVVGLVTLQFYLREWALKNVEYKMRTAIYIEKICFEK